MFELVTLVLVLVGGIIPRCGHMFELPYTPHTHKQLHPQIARHSLARLVHGNLLFDSYTDRTTSSVTHGVTSTLIWITYLLWSPEFKLWTRTTTFSFSLSRFEGSSYTDRTTFSCSDRTQQSLPLPRLLHRSHGILFLGSYTARLVHKSHGVVLLGSYMIFSWSSRTQIGYRVCMYVTIVRLYQAHTERHQHLNSGHKNLNC